MADAQVIHALEIIRLVTVNLFIWDYILTFRMEVDLVWASKWNFMKVLFLVQRYLPFVDTVGLVLYHQLGRDLTPTTCQRVYNISGYMIVAGIALSEMILTLRAWAVWNRTRRMAFILPILYVACWGPDAAFLSIFLHSLRFEESPYDGFVGCFIVKANQTLILCWAVLMIWDAIILLCMAIPGLKAYRAGGNPALLNVVYRDGIIYYIYLFALSSINITVVRILPPEYQNLLTSIERCFHSMLTSRVLLHIRCHTSERQWSDGLTELDLSRLDYEDEYDLPYSRPSRRERLDDKDVES
ncbi:hypothetical protein GALMADRAFT_222795 [Galerina marginata CBS 339.88]|uniref:DUF6533 domain-containing protein n=1 Tax=Galerina marginata (strain CBS 339.88) TaxID=685588 RepID=A0A067TLL6_GALM3|nr:hypothetical protein GALMADRAFT_222795 [Galerina marginata CBS 339.88]